MVGLPALGRQRLDAGRFTAVAAYLNRAVPVGENRLAAGTEHRQAAEQARAKVRSHWISPEADRTDRALADWCTAAERAEPLVADAYRALAELAVVARETAEVIARVEQHERSWIEQTGYTLGDAGSRVVRNANDLLGLISDEQAQRERDEQDAHHRLVEAATIERNQALTRWSGTVEHTAVVLARATGWLRDATVAVPDGLLPREGRTPAEAAVALSARAASLRMQAPADAAPTVDELRRQGLDDAQIRERLQQYWLDQAYEHAGIDPNRWNPGAGAGANRNIIETVYRYYGQLFLDHPELQWAGMANMIGPSFAAGFFDLAMFRDFARRMADTIDGLPAPVRDALPPELRQLRDLAEATDEDLRFYETTFLQMQKDIFADQAVMHEAYLQGGLPAIEELRRAQIIDRPTAQAWEQIDRGRATGDQALIQAGNTHLLHREQWLVIPDQYDAMRDHPVTGQAMTYAMTVIGQPSIPGARFYGEVFPFEVPIETPGPETIGTPSSMFGVPLPHVSVDNPLQGTMTLVTPLPDGNISERNNRWALITHDTLPAYQRLLIDEPDRAQALVASPIDERIDDNRLQQRIDDILGELDNWSIEVRQ